MSLEDKIAALIAAVEANTAALKGGAGKSSSTSTASASSGYKPKHDASKMAAALNEVKEKHGIREAKKIVMEVGGAAKMSEITGPETIDMVYEAAKKRLEEEEGM